MEKEKKEREKEAKKGAEQAKQTGKAHAQREEWEKTLAELRTQVTGLEDQCSKLEHDNQTLLRKLKEQENTLSQRDNKHNDDDDGSDVLKMEEIEMREENMELRQQLLDLRREMDEMYDNFRENEADEFREIQRELDISSKNCRVLQFKLRKAERKADMVDCDRHHYEDKLRKLQMQIENGDCRSHVEALEEELREAKEVSVRLHDELDMMEDRRNKALEDNRHLTEVLEQTDKKQFRMEMEIDKLRDQIADLKQQLRERSPACKEGTPDRRVISSIYTRSID
ncbi:microtubule cross-linking factor 3-like [Littorina saxatilis]|uniref:microtubule cross-linking factor 3-like n=1 Tax=Littorina saxatilis TaxID=31220 RepID=UPI0038B60F9B